MESSFDRSKPAATECYLRCVRRGTSPGGQRRRLQILSDIRDQHIGPDWVAEYAIGSKGQLTNFDVGCHTRVQEDNEFRRYRRPQVPQGRKDIIRKSVVQSVSGNHHSRLVALQGTECCANGTAFNGGPAAGVEERQQGDTLVGTRGCDRDHGGAFVEDAGLQGASNGQRQNDAELGGLWGEREAD